MIDRSHTPSPVHGPSLLPDAGVAAGAPVDPDLASAAMDAAPRAAPDAAARVVWVRSKPPGARVLVDGRFAGNTPLRLVRPASATSLELRKTGYQPFRRRWQPNSEEGDIDAVLLRSRSKPGDARGYLTVNSLPWTRVFLDGQFVGNTPLVRMEVRVGSMQVQLRGADGKLRHSFVAVVEKGATRSYAFDLTKR
jgi:hypothetical protein